MKLVPGLLASGRNSDECRNLRMSDMGLVPVGQLSQLANGDFVPLCYCKKDEKRILLAHRGVYLYEMGEGEEPVAVSQLSAEPLCGVMLDDGAMLMLHDGACRVTWCVADNAWQVVTSARQFPIVRLTVATTSQFSATIPARQLTGNYTHWQGSLDDADCALLTADIERAYDNMCADARRAGCYVQPVMARYRLRDADGAIVVESAPVMLSASGLQLADDIETRVDVDGGRYCMMNAFTLNAEGYTIGYEVVKSGEDNVGNYTVEILVTPQLHPVDWSAQIKTRMESAATLSGVLRLFLPSCRDRCGEQVEWLMHDFDAVAVEVARGRLGESKSVVTRLVGGDYDTDVKLWRKLNPGTVATTIDMMAAEASLPHRFSATVGRMMGDMVVWGNVSTLKYDGYPVPMFTVETNGLPGRWYAFSCVTFANGEQVVWNGGGSGNAPSALSPLVCYPHRDAVKMKVTVCYADSSVKSREVALTAAGTMAVYVDKSFQPLAIDVDEDVYLVPSTVCAPRVYGGGVMVARAIAPLEVVAAQVVSQEPVVAITPAVRSTSSWDFARSHLYAFSRGGIYAVSVNAGRSSISSCIIDDRSVVLGSAVAVTPAQVYAVASGALVAVAGSRVKTVIPDIGCVKIGWNHVWSELWCIAPDARVSVLTGHGFYRRDEIVDAVHDVGGGRLLVCCDQRLCDASCEIPAEMNVCWSKCVPIEWQPIKHIAWLLYASSAQLSLSVKGDHGGNTPLSIIGLQVSGQINSPVSARVYAPPRGYVTLTVDGSVSADMLFESIIMKIITR